MKVKKKVIIIKVKDSQSQINELKNQFLMATSYEHNLKQGGDTLRNISDIIEQHLKGILQESPNGAIEIQRSDIAEKFQCVPSQINYVINTRFSIEKGYIVESKRGGGGFIRIRKAQILCKDTLQELLTEELIGDSVTQAFGYSIIDRLVEERWISLREATLMKVATSRQVLMVSTPLRDQLRANILKHMITTILIT